MLLEVVLWTIVVLVNTSVDFFLLRFRIAGHVSIVTTRVTALPRSESGSSNVEMITFVNINMNCKNIPRGMKNVFCSSVFFKMILIVAFLNDLLCFPPKTSAFIKITVSGWFTKPQMICALWQRQRKLHLHEHP